MSTATIKLPRLHAGQLKVKREAKRYNVLDMGRRWGKTTIGLDIIIHPALKGFPVAWYAPQNRTLNEIWERAKVALQPIITRQQESSHTLELNTGGKIEMWSLQDEKTANASRGRKYKLIAIDEAAHISNLKYAWQMVIRPQLTDLKGDAWFYSSPAGMNYFKELWDRGQDPLRPSWMSWQMPSTSNPHLPAGEIEEAREDLTELAFAQEYEAQFVSWEGAVFRRITDAIAQDLPCEPEREHAYVIGVDWGQKNDFTVFAVVDATARKLAYIDRTRGIPYTLQQERLKALQEKWHNASVVAEENSMGGPIIEAMNKAGIKVKPFLTTNESKAAIIEQLVLDFERGMIQIPNDPALIGELQAFTCSPTRTGLKYYGAPKDGHDDTVIALAIAWSGAAKALRKIGPIVIGGDAKPSNWGRMSG